ncbi:MAG TPA: hypothetical protein P5076_19065, partial [Myxococcota bacterium]|nr:hypothetical protein [Myxococcota bacterium]
MPRARSWSMCLACLACLACLPARGAEEHSFAVLDLVCEGSVSQEQNEALVDRLVNEIQALGDFRVLGGTTIRSMLKLEENKLLLGCRDDACMAEIGGALGVSFLMRGNISRFGERYLVSLQVLDTRRILVAGGVSEEISGDLEALLAAIPPMVRRMFHDLAPQLGLSPAWAAGLVEEERLFELEAHALIYGGMWAGEQRELSSDLDARGDMTGDRLGGGLRFALRLGDLHALWLGFDYQREAWRGQAPCEAPDCDPGLSDRLSIEVSLDELRVLLGYRFAYPLLDWLEPYAELGLGVQVGLPRSLE